MPSSANATTEGVVLAPTKKIRVRISVSFGRFLPQVQVLTFGVLDDFGLAGLHDCDAGVGGAKIDTDNATKNAKVRD